MKFIMNLIQYNFNVETGLKFYGKKTQGLCSVILTNHADCMLLLTALAYVVFSLNKDKIIMVNLKISI